jgi:hypothetical protein
MPIMLKGKKKINQNITEKSFSTCCVIACIGIIGRALNCCIFRRRKTGRQKLI